MILIFNYGGSRNSVSGGRFATLIGCIDGRVQTPLNAWIRKKYSVDYVDTITEPGVDRWAGDLTYVGRIKEKAKISRDAHGSDLIVVSGHYQCAANPGSAENHIPQIRQWVDVINSWGWGSRTVGVWVNKDWAVEPVTGA